jgi:Flagellar protein FliT
LLAELRRLRELQLEQGDALAAADLDRLSTLDRERRAVQSQISPRGAPPPSPADMAEARALVDLLARDQRELLQRAAAARDALGEEIGSLGAGRTALAGYRPAATGRSLYLDHSG